MKNLIKYTTLHALLVITSTIITCPHNKNLDTIEPIVEIKTSDHHQTFLTHNQGPSVVFYHIDGCHYCNKTQPVFENLARNDQFDHITFYSANGPKIKAKNDIESLTNQTINGYPTILFFNKGEIVDSQVGATDQNVIIQKLNDLDTSLIKTNISKKSLSLQKSKKNNQR